MEESVRREWIQSLAYSPHPALFLSSFEFSANVSLEVLNKILHVSLTEYLRSKSGEGTSMRKESSSQIESWPADDADPDITRQVPSAPSPERHSPVRSRPLFRRNSSAENSSSADLPLRVRSRPPHVKTTVPRVLGFNLEELRYVRLKPYNNPNRIFHLRNYTFPIDKPIRLKNRSHTLLPMPTGSQIVFSTSNGDVFAILRRRDNRSMVVRGMYKLDVGKIESARAKINIYSEEVEELTQAEIVDCPIANHFSIRSCFNVYRVQDDF